MAFVKSLFWLTGFGGFAYILLETITPKDSDIRKLLPEGQAHHRPDPNQQATFIKNLKRAADNKKSMVQGNQSSNHQTSSTVEK